MSLFASNTRPTLRYPSIGFETVVIDSSSAVVDNSNNPGNNASNSLHRGGHSVAGSTISNNRELNIWELNDINNSRRKPNFWMLVEINKIESLFLRAVASFFYILATIVTAGLLIGIEFLIKEIQNFGIPAPRDPRLE